jgi:hypothetical protein
MRVLLLLSFLSFPFTADFLAQTSGVEIFTNPYLNAGGMGILGFLLYKQIQFHNKTVSTVADSNKEGLIALAKELHGLRSDLRVDLQENRRLLTMTLGFGPKKEEQ